MPGLLEEQPKEEDTNKKAFPHAAAAAGAGPNANGTSANAPLPKGVVLDKDGKPYAPLPYSTPLYSSSVTHRVADKSTDVEHAHPPPPGCR